MKELKKLYEEIVSSEELKKEFLDAAEKGDVEGFLKSHDCEASLDDVEAFLIEQNEEMKALSEDEMDNVAGGTCNKTTGHELLGSVVTFGVACAIGFVRSLRKGKIGQRSDEDGRLCDPSED